MCFTRLEVLHDDLAKQSIRQFKVHLDIEGASVLVFSSSPFSRPCGPTLREEILR